MVGWRRVTSWYKTSGLWRSLWAMRQQGRTGMVVCPRACVRKVDWDTMGWGGCRIGRRGSSAGAVNVGPGEGCGWRRSPTAQRKPAQGRHPWKAMTRRCTAWANGEQRSSVRTADSADSVGRKKGWRCGVGNSLVLTVGRWKAARRRGHRGTCRANYTAGVPCAWFFPATRPNDRCCRGQTLSNLTTNSSEPFAVPTSSPSGLSPQIPAPPSTVLASGSPGRHAVPGLAWPSLARP